MKHKKPPEKKPKRVSEEKDPNEIIWGLTLGGILLIVLAVIVLLTLYVGG